MKCNRISTNQPLNKNYGLIQQQKPAADAVVPPEKIRQEMFKNLDKHTLVIYKNGEVKYYDQRNLKPVFLALEDNKNDFSECFITDRRISKASAMLFVYGGAKYIQTPIMTKSAKELFDKHGVMYRTDEIADSVVDKNSKIQCPLEKLVLNTDNPEEGYQILKQKVFPKGME